MRGLRSLSIAAAVVAAVALLSSAAGAANRGADVVENGPAGTAPRANPSDEREMPVVELPAAASEAAVEHSATGLATANAAIATAAERAAERDERTANQGEAAMPEPIAAKERPAVAGGPETVPGWGCGDSTRTHTGPAGKPEPSPPPGCDR